MNRCTWAKTPEEELYHDNEWGRPITDDRVLFEMLILEGMQAGLSWLTVLRKREEFRKAFDGFDVELVALYDEDKIEELMGNAGIIRNRRKILAAVRNAEVFLEIVEECGTFYDYLWTYVDHKVIKNSFEKLEDIPAKTELSEEISKDLKRRGMNFVGPTIIYAYLQSVGVVNDHLVDCFLYKENL